MWKQDVGDVKGIYMPQRPHRTPSPVFQHPDVTSGSSWSVIMYSSRWYLRMLLYDAGISTRDSRYPRLGEIDVGCGTLQPDNPSFDIGWERSTSSGSSACALAE